MNIEVTAMKCLLKLTFNLKINITSDITKMEISMFDFMACYPLLDNSMLMSVFLKQFYSFK